MSSKLCDTCVYMSTCFIIHQAYKKLTGDKIFIVSVLVLTKCMRHMYIDCIMLAS